MTLFQMYRHDTHPVQPLDLSLRARMVMASRADFLWHTVVKQECLLHRSSINSTFMLDECCPSQSRVHVNRHEDEAMRDAINVNGIARKIYLEIVSDIDTNNAAVKCVIILRCATSLGARAWGSCLKNDNCGNGYSIRGCVLEVG